MSPPKPDWIPPTLASWAGKKYPKHLPPYERDDWKVVVRETIGAATGHKKPKPVARCIHSEDFSLTHGAIRQMEFECLTRTDRQEVPAANPRIRVYWQKRSRIIGASLGQETAFIRVQVGQDGVYHGRPITAKELNEEGVAWNLLQ